MSLFSKASHHEPPRIRDPKLADMPFDELVALKRDVDEEVQARQAAEVESLRQKVTNTAKALGVSVSALFRQERKPMYKHDHAV